MRRFIRKRRVALGKPIPIETKHQHATARMLRSPRSNGDNFFQRGLRERHNYLPSFRVVQSAAAIGEPSRPGIPASLHPAEISVALRTAGREHLRVMRQATRVLRDVN